MSLGIPRRCLYFQASEDRAMRKRVDENERELISDKICGVDLQPSQRGNYRKGKEDAVGHVRRRF